jgi:hypothetical protein
MLIPGRNDTERLLSLVDIVAALDAVFRRHPEGHTALPPRSVTSVGDRALLFVMPPAAPGARRSRVASARTA